MPGQPQVREAGLLYGDDPYVPLAMVRLGAADGRVRRLVGAAEQPGGRAPAQRAEHSDEQSARAELERVYEQGRAYGQWKIRRPREDQVGTT